MTEANHPGFQLRLNMHLSSRGTRTRVVQMLPLLAQEQTATETGEDRKAGKESRAYPCSVARESPHTSKCPADRAVGAAGAGPTLRLTSPAPPLARGVAVGEEGQLRTEGYVCF